MLGDYSQVISTIVLEQSRGKRSLSLFNKQWRLETIGNPHVQE